MDRRSVLASSAIAVTTAIVGCVTSRPDSSSEAEDATATPERTPTRTDTVTGDVATEDATSTPTDDAGDGDPDRDHDRRWHHETPASIEGFVEGLVVSSVADSDNNQLFALDLGSGTRQWTYERASGWYYTYPGFTVADAIYFGQKSDEVGGSGHLYAVEFDGEERWQIETRGVVSLAVTETGVYAGIQSTAVQAVEPDTGEERWQYDLAAEHGWDRPRAPDVRSGGDTLYAAGEEVVALDPSGPDVLWRFGEQYGYTGISAIDDGVVFVDTTAGPGAVVDGQQRWLVEDGSDLVEVTADLVIAESEDGSFQAFDRETGTKRWTSRPIEGRRSSSTLAPETLYVVTDGTLSALDVASGDLRWQTQVAEKAPIALDDGSGTSPGLYVATEPKRVGRLNADGSETWSVSTAGEIAGIVAENALFVETSAGLTAFEL